MSAHPSSEDPVEEPALRAGGGVLVVAGAVDAPQDQVDQTFRIRLEPQRVQKPVRQAFPAPAAETFADRLPRAMALRQVPASGFGAELQISPFTACRWSRQRPPPRRPTRGTRSAINSHSASLSSCRRIASLPLGDLHQEQPPPAVPCCSGRQSKPLPVAALIPCRDRGSFPPRPCRRSGRSC